MMPAAQFEQRPIASAIAGIQRFPPGHHQRLAEQRFRGPFMPSEIAIKRGIRTPGAVPFADREAFGKATTAAPQHYAADVELAWAEYLETHARRAYGSVTVPEVAAAKAIISRIRKGDLKREFSSREVWRPGWAMLSDREQVTDALHLLVDFDWLAIATKDDTGGRPATIYAVNPRGFQS